MKDELGGKIMTKFIGLRTKTYSYLIDDGSENCLETSQLNDKIQYLEKIKINIDSLKKFIRNKKSILKTQQGFKSERHNVFTEEINKIALSSNDDKRMQSLYSIET